MEGCPESVETTGRLYARESEQLHCRAGVAWRRIRVMEIAEISKKKPLIMDLRRYSRSRTTQHMERNSYIL